MDERIAEIIQHTYDTEMQRRAQQVFDLWQMDVEAVKAHARIEIRESRHTLFVYDFPVLCWEPGFDFQGLTYSENAAEKPRLSMQWKCSDPVGPDAFGIDTPEMLADVKER